jgi:hypothetical protein
MDIPASVVAAQRAFDQAWAALEAYRKGVDTDRRATAEPPAERHGLPTLRPWTDDENREYDRLHTTALRASEARAEAMQAKGIASTWDTERAMRAAVRESAEV